MPVWIQPASFTPEMYRRLLGAVIRPGIGTITDALLGGARLFMFYESDNFEMIHNADKIAESGLGEVFSDAAVAWKAALKYLSNVVSQVKHSVALQGLDCNGAAHAATILLAASRHKD
jgi:hypothetical protein